MRIGEKSSPICSKSGRRNAGAYQIQLYFQGNTEAGKMFISENGIFNSNLPFSMQNWTGKNGSGMEGRRNTGNQNRKEPGEAKKNARQDPFDNKEFFR